MFDKPQPRGVPVQSWAIVLAAIISSCGVIAAALVQTGWALRLAQASASSQPSTVPRLPESVAEATFTGVIEPVCTCRDCMVRPATAVIEDIPSSHQIPASLESVHQSPGPVPLPPVAP